VSGDWVLVIWILTSALWDVLVFGTTTYLVFWKDHSGWWFVLAVALCCQVTLFKARRKRYGVPEDKET